MSVIINNMAMPQNCYECRFCETYLGHHLCVAFLNYIADPRSGRLDTCPLEEVQEPKRGKWIQTEISPQEITQRLRTMKCSCCGEYQTAPYFGTFKVFNFCPNCGVRMDV